MIGPFALGVVMSFHKTGKARAELTPGTRSLTQRERTLLLMADGNKSFEDLGALFGGEGSPILLKLVREGYLERRPLPATSKALPVAPVPALRPPPRATPASTDLTPAQRDAYPSPETTQALRAAADSFEGKRSLATTRMFLFDICERMFARRDPAKAERFREALRQARDRDSMLGAGRDMINEIEKVAGHERADSISERIAMLLPPELVV